MTPTVIHIISAEQIDRFQIRITFDDGCEQTVDFKPFLLRSQHPDIRAYLDSANFSTFRIDYGELIWGDYDLCFPIIDLYQNDLMHCNPIEIVAA